MSGLGRAMQSKTFKKPWYVYHDQLCSQFKSRIVEIADANGDVVLPWPGFDATGLSHNAQIKLAQRIVDAVNGKRGSSA
jgi:hypothetical protein